MKKYIAGAVLAVACNGAPAQIPVTDVAQITANAVLHVETILKWIDQYRQMVEQYEKLTETHEALTGVRNLGDVFDDRRLRKYLPDDWRDAYRAMKRSGYEGLVRKSVEIYRDNQVHDSCEGYERDDHRLSCESRAVKGAQDQGYASEAYDLAVERAVQIQHLQDEINLTEDPKAIAELQARIMIEQTNMANEQTKLEIYWRMADSEDRIQKQRSREIHARAFASVDSVDVEPLTFD